MPVIPTFKVNSVKSKRACLKSYFFRLTNDGILLLMVFNQKYLSVNITSVDTWLK